MIDPTMAPISAECLADFPEDDSAADVTYRVTLGPVTILHRVAPGEPVRRWPAPRYFPGLDRHAAANLNPAHLRPGSPEYGTLRARHDRADVRLAYCPAPLDVLGSALWLIRCLPDGPPASDSLSAFAHFAGEYADPVDPPECADLVERFREVCAMAGDFQRWLGAPLEAYAPLIDPDATHTGPTVDHNGPRSYVLAEQFGDVLATYDDDPAAADRHAVGLRMEWLAR